MSKRKNNWDGVLKIMGKEPWIVTICGKIMSANLFQNH